MDCEEFNYYGDESLESCLLRLSQFHGYERFNYFAEEMLFRVLDQHCVVSGSLPFDLKRINIYHAQVSRQMRVKAIQQLEEDLGLDRYQILRLALTRSENDFSPELRGIHRAGVDYPQIMLRRKHTPICPECLRESSYVRQSWQFLPYQACHVHGCKLLDKCPQCSRSLDYQYSESITCCECGYSLLDAEISLASDSELMVAKWFSDVDAGNFCRLPSSMSLSERYGFLLWYVNRYGENQTINLNAFVEYCSQWPKPFIKEIKHLAKDADIKRIRPWYKTHFEEVFGSLLKNCRNLPSNLLKNNIVLRVALITLTDIVRKHPDTKSGNVGDILLSRLDASSLLSCSSEKVYQLYELGEIKSSISPPLHTKLPSYQPAFTLRSIVETKYALMRSEDDGTEFFDSEWDT